MLSFLANLGIGSVVKQLAAAYEAKQRAATDGERIAADLEISTLEAKRDILLAEAGSGGPTAWIRPLLALPFVIYLWKLVVWDKVLAMGVTDALSPELTEIMMLIIGAYFVGRSAEKVARIVKRR